MSPITTIPGLSIRFDSALELKRFTERNEIMYLKEDSCFVSQGVVIYVTPRQGASPFLLKLCRSSKKSTQFHWVKSCLRREQHYHSPYYSVGFNRDVRRNIRGLNIVLGKVGSGTDSRNEMDVQRQLQTENKRPRQLRSSKAKELRNWPAYAWMKNVQQQERDDQR